MNTATVSKTKIESKLAIIRESLHELEDLGGGSKQQFVEHRFHFAAAEHHLRRALEAVFDISGHIISRYPNSTKNRPSTYREFAAAIAEKGIVSKSFGEDKLSEMAGYRNRLTHLYDEVTKEEMYEIITNDLGDIEHFAKRITHLLKNPEEFGLELEE